MTPNELLLLRLFRCLSPVEQADFSMELASKVMAPVLDEASGEDQDERVNEFVRSTVPGMAPWDTFDEGIHDALESTWPLGLAHGIFFGEADLDEDAAEILLEAGSAYLDSLGWECYVTVEQCFMFIQSWRERVLRELESTAARNNLG
ncbi:hypothetical protein D3C87_1428180 [compost metagenome]